MKKTDLAYYAGFFDGEGSIGIYFKNYKTGFSPTLRISLTNTNIWILQSFKFAFNGSIGPPSNSGFNKGRTPVWKWGASHRQALYFLEAIVPYLKLKRAEAELAIKFQKAKAPKGTKTTPEHKALEEAQMILMKSYKSKKTWSKEAKTREEEKCKT